MVVGKYRAYVDFVSCGWQSQTLTQFMGCSAILESMSSPLQGSQEHRLVMFPNSLSLFTYIKDTERSKSTCTLTITETSVSLMTYVCSKESILDNFYIWSQETFTR